MVTRKAVHRRTIAWDSRGIAPSKNFSIVISAIGSANNCKNRVAESGRLLLQDRSSPDCRSTSCTGTEVGTDLDEFLIINLKAHGFRYQTGLNAFPTWYSGGSET